MPIANIVLKVSNYKKARPCAVAKIPLKMHLNSGAPTGVTLLKGSNKLEVERSVTLRFTLAWTGGDTYRPIAISFTRKAMEEFDQQPKAVYLTDHKVGGWEPFSGLRLDGSSLEVHDKILTRTPGKKDPHEKTFVFALLIQRESDGALGLIDPEIENDN
jgi:hypothetical protein